MVSSFRNFVRSEDTQRGPTQFISLQGCRRFAVALQLNENVPVWGANVQDRHIIGRHVSVNLTRDGDPIQRTLTT
jgi:hypothetical protein